MKYSLLFGDRTIASIVAEGGDFPGFSGRFALDDAARADSELEPVFAYAAYSVRTAMEGDEDDFSDEYYDGQVLHQRIIESEAWALVDERGERTPILVPVFGPGDEVTWRLG